MSFYLPCCNILKEAEREVLKAVPPGTPPGCKGKETNAPKVTDATKEAFEFLLFIHLPK